MIKNLATAIAAVFLALVPACQTYPAPAPPTHSSVVEHINEATVALVRVSDTGDVRPFCSGVWVSADKVLTAAHCTEGSDVFLVAASEISPLKLAVKDRVAMEKDLALLQIIGTPQLHDTARTAIFDPKQGDELHMLGMTKGFWFSYGHGYVAAFRGQDFEGPDPIKGPFMQVTAEGVWRGNSGSGAFNASGELVGICSFMTRSLETVHFYIPIGTIRGFLANVQ